MSAGCDFEFMEYIDEKSIDANLLCHICTKPFKDPVCTPCDHSFGRACIKKWFDTNKNGSCPMCKMEPIKEENLTRISGPLRNIMDNIPVRCLLCEKMDLIRGNFKDHLEKTCPKAQVTCKAADIKCPWEGTREDLSEHMNACVFEPLRPVLTVLIAENQKLKSQVQNHAAEIKKLAQKIDKLDHEQSDDSDAESVTSEADSSKKNDLYEKEENAIFVRNVPSSVKFNDLFTFFSQIGRIKFNPRNQKPELFIFQKLNQPNMCNVKVSYVDKASADAAVAEYNCKHVPQWNIRLQVGIAFSKKKNMQKQREEASGQELTAKNITNKAHKRQQSNSTTVTDTSAIASGETSQQPGRRSNKNKPVKSKEVTD